jgi:hypothetical protein
MGGLGAPPQAQSQWFPKTRAITVYQPIVDPASVRRKV